MRVWVRRNFNIIGPDADAGADKFRDLRCGWKCGCRKKNTNLCAGVGAGAVKFQN